MKVLYCSWYENSKKDMVKALDILADEVFVIEHSVKEYIGDNKEVVYEVIDILSNGIDVVISFDFLPMLSDTCSNYGITYISWIYDWPNYTLYSKAIYNKCNEIYLFERDGIKLLSKYGIGNMQYASLAVDTDRLDRQLGKDIDNTSYEYDISFVGNMNPDLKSVLMNKDVPSYYEGYINGLANAQQKIYGYNIINDIIDDEFVDKYLYAACADMDNIAVPHEHVMASQINKYVTGVERVNLLRKIADKYMVDIFTGSRDLDIANADIHSGVDYYSEMPVIFRKSRINLNITLRSITTGIPLRVYDILGAGGFCLTNYQEDIEQLFKNGEELVMFTDENDMLNKIDYYMCHEKERMEIAVNGHKAVKKFDYIYVLKHILGVD